MLLQKRIVHWTAPLEYRGASIPDVTDLDLVVGLDDAVGDSLVTQLLKGDQHVLLLLRQRFSKRLRPVEVLAHHRDRVLMGVEPEMPLTI